MSDDQTQTPRQLARDFLLSTSSIEGATYMLEDYGFTPKEAGELAEVEAVRMVRSCDPSLRPSFSAVCSWHRWHGVLTEARQNMQTERAAEAMQHIDRLIASVH